MLLEVDEEHDSGTVSILPSSASTLPSAPIIIEVSRAVPSCTRSILTEIYLGHAGSWHDGNAPAGHEPRPPAQPHLRGRVGRRAGRRRASCGESLGRRCLRLAAPSTSERLAANKALRAWVRYKVCTMARPARHCVKLHTVGTPHGGPSDLTKFSRRFAVHCVSLDCDLVAEDDGRRPHVVGSVAAASIPRAVRA